MRAVLVLLAAPLALAGKSAPEPEPSIADVVMGLVMDVVNSSVDAGKDALGYVIAAPRFLVDCYTWSLGVVRSLPGLATSMYSGDKATLDSCVDFAVSTATIVFAAYMGLAALNLLVGAVVQVKDYFQDYMTISLPKKTPQPIASAVTKVTDVIQKELLNRVKNFKQPNWIVPLDSSQAGKPTIAKMTGTCTAAATLCMVLSCAPSVLSLMRGGANKGDAEAIAWTLGTALGVQYLVKLV